MERRRIEGTKHIRRRPRKGAIIAGISAIVIATIATLGAFIYQGKISMPKLRGEKSIISESITVESEENLFVLGGTGSASSIINVSPGASNYGRVSGTGTLEMSKKNTVPGEEGSKYLELSAIPDKTGIRFNGWDIDGKTIKLKDNPLRIYYYDDASMVGEYSDGVYVTNKGVKVTPLFITPVTGGAPNNGDATITAIVTPNVGKMSVGTINKDDGKQTDNYVTVNGYVQLSYDTSKQNITVDMETTAGENYNFMDNNNPRYAWYIYDKDGQLKEYNKEQPGNSLFKDKDGNKQRTYSDGTILLVNPHLKSGFENQAVGIAVPQDGGTVAWSGSQLKAQPDSGWKFDHWEWFEYSDKRESKDNPMMVSPLGVIVYKAIFVKAQYQVSVSGVTPANSCTVSGTDLYDENTDATITVTPQPGYKFKDATWTTTDGIYHHAQGVTTDSSGVTTFIVDKVKEDISLTIEMDSSKFTIDVKANPSSGAGTVSVENLTSPTAPGPLIKEDFNAGDKAQITATANSGYVFLYWEDSNGNRYSDATLTIDKVYLSESFKAYFATSAVSFQVDINPAITLTDAMQIYYIDTTGKNQSKTVAFGTLVDDIKPNTTVLIEAPSTVNADTGLGYNFMNYTKDGDTSGKVYSDTSLSITNIITNTKYQANYIPVSDKLTIYMNSDPSAGGNSSITGDGITSSAPNEYQVKHGTEITLNESENSGYRFLYFLDGNGNKIDKENATFKALNDKEKFQAVFAMDKVKITAKAESGKGDVVLKYTDVNESYIQIQTDIGSAKNSVTASDVKGGTNITLVGKPKLGYHITKFTDGSGKDYPVTTGSDSVTIPNVLQNTEYQAVFDSNKYKVSYNVSPYDGGIVTINESTNNPSLVLAGSSAKITATANTGYKFLYFKLPDGTRKGNDYSIEHVNEDTNITAVFAKDTGTLTIGVTPSDGGLVETQYTNTSDVNRTVESMQIDDIKTGTSVTLTAIPKMGYTFAGFQDPISGNSLSPTSPFTIPSFGTPSGATTPIDSVVAVFNPQTFTINTTIDPSAASGCSAVLNTETESGQEIHPKYGEEVTITATPGNGWRFKYFEDASGNRYEGTDIGGGKVERKFTASSAMTLKACFGYNEIKLNVRVTPSDDAGGYVVSYTDVEGNKVVTDELHGTMPFVGIKGYSDLEIRAISKTGYKFLEFTDTDKGVFTTNPLIYNDLAEHKDVTIHFVPDENEIKVVSSPEMGGIATVNGSTSSQKVQPGQDVEILATPNDGYTFKMFKDSQGNEFVSNPLNFKAVNGSETYTAYFVKKDITVTIDLTPSGSGTVRFNEDPAVSKRTTYTTDGRSTVKLTAMPKENIEFTHWVDQDGNAYPDNPLTIVDISKDLTFTAVFANDSIGVKAVASPASGGTIKKIVNDNGSITLIATPNKGYTFANWKKGDRLLTLGTKYTVAAANVHDGDVYTAYFKYNPNYDAKSDITKEKFYREWRKVVTPNYTVTRDSMKLLAMQTVSGLRQYDDAAPDLRSYNAVANAQAYFDEKVAKDIQRLDGIFGDSELMTVEGEVLPPDLLPDFTVYEKIAREFTDKKFGKHYDTEILTVKRVIQPENFDNVKRTYLWRYTGAEFKDNIYLLYEIDSKKPKWVSPIVDPDGVLKFTINKLPDKDIVAVVRVKIKD